MLHRIRAGIQEKEDGVMLKKILVATDGSDHAKKAIEFASDVASRYGATVYIIHVVFPLPSMLQGYDVGKIEESQQKVAREIIEAAEKEIRQKGIENYQSVMLHGDPAREIIEFARQEGIDTIVMGSHGAGRAEMLLLGSVSHKVCHLADCTCMTVK
jgi:nucleotide-binding universal stress UspA family protein